MLIIISITKKGGIIMMSVDIMKSLNDILSPEPLTEYKPFPKLDDSSITVNFEICSTCAGKYCCQVTGCHFSPDDFEDLSFEGLRAKLDQGYISIDIIFEEQFYLGRDILVLRTRNKDSNIYDATYFRCNKPCDLLTPTGCPLPYEERPSGGRLVIPSADYNCGGTYGGREVCIEWNHFQEVLWQLAKYYKESEKNHYYENQLVKKLIRKG